jgi:alpha-2-macroglobulin
VKDVRINKYLAILLILSVLAMACQCPLSSVFVRSTPTPELAPTAAGPTPTPLPPLPPQVIQIAPARGEEQPLDAPLQFVFDQPMDEEAVESAFSIEPQVAGAFEWVSPRAVQFRPAGAGFKRATRYTVTIDEQARSDKDVSMKAPVRFEFATVGYLEVGAVQPADETEEVVTDAVVTVAFNRPVVPLVAIEDQDNLPQPLTFTPPVRGTGEWINTSIYAFTPAEDDGFDPATTYKARIGAGLTDTTGGVLEEDFTWEFTTIMPAVVGAYPGRQTTYVSLEPAVHVAFNQPMDRDGVEDFFELRNLSTDETVAGAFEWRDEGLVLPDRKTYEPYQWSWSAGAGPERVGAETMIFTPDQPLDFDTAYRATVDAGAPGATGSAGTESSYTWTFDTIREPRILSTSPRDGEQSARPWGGLEITFSSPMDPESINGNFTISPSVDLGARDVYTHWWDSDTKLEISFPIKASADYEVTISGAVRGRYGHELGEDTTVRWRTRAYDPMVYLHSMGRIVTYNAYTRTLAMVTVRNVEDVHFSLYRMPLDDFLRATGSNSWNFWKNYNGRKEHLVREWTMDVNPPLNQRSLYGTKLAEREDGLLDPGLYFLQVRPGEIYPEARYGSLSSSKEILVVSRHNLSVKTTVSQTLAWATDLRSGDVSPDMPVTVMDDAGDVMDRGSTDQDGVFLGRKDQSRDRWSPVYVFLGDPENPGADFSLAINQWDSGIGPWQFGLPMNYDISGYAGYFFTDRPIYRPGQTVYFKGVIRADDDAHYALPDDEKLVHISISDAEGKTIHSEDLELSDVGTVDGEIELDEEASLGNYSIQATYLESKDAQFYTSFQVAEYRKPEFQVEVKTDRLEYANGDQINVTAQATYFFGGLVADAEVRYVVLSNDYTFRYQGKGRWDFDDRSYDYWWWWRQPGGSYGERIAEGEGVTDADGRFTFELDADIAEETSSQNFTLEVTVTDVNNQEVSNRTTAIVHKGHFYIGLSPERYVGRVNEENQVDLITVDWESEPLPDQEVTVVFARRNWYSVQKQGEDGRYYWESGVEDVPVFTTTVETDAEGLGQVSFTPEAGGTYKVIATGVDRAGNEVRSSTFTWVSGRSYISWRRDNNDRIDLVTDKQQYQVGDTASILVPHPYQGEVEALVTVERGYVYEHWVETLETNSEQIEIPITEDLIPNVFVSVVVFQGSDENEGGGTPSFKVGYAQLSIDTTEKELNIELTPDRAADEHYQPGDEATYDVHVTDSAGDPVEAELALDLVDLAVLTLADRPGMGLLNYFWRERGLGVNTAVGLTLSGDRISEELGDEVKGMGGGGGGEEFGPVRERFPDLAYWNPDLRTDEDGRAQISVELPDNLTTWRLTARGVDARTLVGEAQVDVISTKSLLLRPVAPRFFVVGDEAELAVVIHNNTNDPLDVEVALQAQGLEIHGAARTQTSIPANDKVKLAWPVTVLDSDEVTLRFGARSAQADLADAVEIALPVYRYSTPEVVATAGYMDEDGERLEAVALPPRYDPTQGELSVHVDPSLAAGMVESLEYLEHFPYECTEQTVSRFLPNVVTYRVFEELGVARPDLEARLPALVNRALQRLYNQQHYNGGWGWWVQDESRPYLTAYVLLGMIEADRAGFTVDRNVMNRAARYLRGSLRSRRDLEEHWKANEQAFILYVLAEAGIGDLSRMETLFQQRDALDTFGEAYLAMAYGVLEEVKQSRIDTLLSDITSDALLSATGAHWEEERVDYYAMNTDTRSTAIVLAALARLDPDNALGANTVRWLMAVRKSGRWETTQENVWAILGLTDWMVATGELEGHYGWRVTVNGELLGEGEVDQDNLKETTQLQIEVARLLAEEANRVLIQRDAPVGEVNGEGRLYYSMYLRYFKPVEDVTALDRGVIVSRRYTRVDCDGDNGCPAVDEAQVGDVIQVNLTIIAPHDLHYVVVEDPFPAGAEGVDVSLKTTSIAQEGPQAIRTDRSHPWWGGWGAWWFRHTEMRDEKAVLFATYLPKGTYEYTYLIRASLPGEFRAIPTHAYEMYFPEVFGRSDGGLFTIYTEANDQ